MSKQGKSHRGEIMQPKGRVKSQSRRLAKKADRALRAAELDRSPAGRYRAPHPMAAQVQ